MALPIIGLTLDAEPPGGYSALPWNALRENYCAAVVRAGGLSVLLPHEVEQADSYLRVIDGLVVTGGAFDVDPAIFGAETRHPTIKTKDRRTQFELAVTRRALSADKPVLGICGGQQLLNVALGGTLIQHIPDEVPGALAHKQANGNEPGHLVRFTEGTRLREIAGCAEAPVNSTHHQAVKAPGTGPPGRCDGARRHRGGHRGPAPPVLYRRAMASRIRHQRDRPPAVRGLHRRGSGLIS